MRSARALGVKPANMRLAWCVLALSLCLFAPSAPAQTAVPQRARAMRVEQPLRVRVPGFRWDHEVRVALPAGYAADGRRYPVLWLTDGATTLDIALAYLDGPTARGMPAMIVVAVGSPPGVPAAEASGRRLYDFTPSRAGPVFRGYGDRQVRALWRKKPAGRDAALAVGKAYGFGGGPAFLDYLVDDLRPVLAARYRMSGDHVLFGDSAGGIFCGYALLARPEAFSRYICGSPGFNWGDHELFRLEQRMAKSRRDVRADVFFGAGEAELLENHPLGVVSSMARMTEILRARDYPSLKLTARIFRGENHASVLPLNLRCGLQALYAAGGDCQAKP